MLEYIEARVEEMSSMLGLWIFTFFISYYLVSGDFHLAPLSSVGLLMAALPDRILFLYGLFKRCEKMAVNVTTLEQLLSESPDFIKVAQDLVKLYELMESKDVAAILANAKQWEADAVKCYNDIKTLGQTQGA